MNLRFLGWINAWIMMGKLIGEKGIVRKSRILSTGEACEMSK